MSSKRIVASCAAMALVVVGCSWYAVSAFPLQQSSTFVPAQQEAPGPIEQRANAITPENPIPRRVMSEKMLYPAEAALVQARGEVTLQVTLDELGRVAEARVIQVGIRSPEFEVAIASTSMRESIGRGTLRMESGKTATILDVYDAIARAATDAVQQWRYDPPFKAPISFPVTLSFGPVWKDLGEEPVRQLRSEGVRVEVSPAGGTSNEGAIRVGEGGITAPKKIRDVRPVYPAIARAAGVQGVVIVEARIEHDGAVGTARILRSIPLLDAAALDAVRQWRFTPTLLNGRPVAVIMTVTIDFNLGERESPQGDKS